jgi:hypothetical protein
LKLILPTPFHHISYLLRSVLRHAAGLLRIQRLYKLLKKNRAKEIRDMMERRQDKFFSIIMPPSSNKGKPCFPLNTIRVNQTGTPEPSIVLLLCLLPTITRGDEIPKRTLPFRSTGCTFAITITTKYCYS